MVPGFLCPKKRTIRPLNIEQYGMWNNQHSEKNECSIFIPFIGPLKSSFETVRIRPLQDGGIWFPDIVPINLSQAVIMEFKKAKIEYGSFHHAHSSF